MQLLTEKILGGILIFAGAVLYATKYLAAAIYSVSATGVKGSFGYSDFQVWLSYVGNRLTFLALLSAAVGAYFVVAAEWRQRKLK